MKIKEVDSLDSFKQCFMTLSVISIVDCCELLSNSFLTDDADVLLNNILSVKMHDERLAIAYINELLWCLRHDLEFSNFVKCESVNFKTGKVYFKHYDTQQFAE